MTNSKNGQRPDGHDQAARNEIGSTQPEKTSGKKPPRPSQCRNFTREAVAESMPAIVGTFVNEAVKGSVSHFNLLTKFGGFDHRPVPAPAPRKRKGFARRVFEDMKEHQAKILAANEARIAAESDNGK